MLPNIVPDQLLRVQPTKLRQQHKNVDQLSEIVILRKNVPDHQKLVRRMLLKEEEQYVAQQQRLVMPLNFVLEVQELVRQMYSDQAHSAADALSSEIAMESMKPALQMHVQIVLEAHS